MEFEKRRRIHRSLCFFLRPPSILLLLLLLEKKIPTRRLTLLLLLSLLLLRYFSGGNDLKTISVWCDSIPPRRCHVASTEINLFVCFFFIFFSLGFRMGKKLWAASTFYDPRCVAWCQKKRSRQPKSTKESQSRTWTTTTTTKKNNRRPACGWRVRVTNGWWLLILSLSLSLSIRNPDRDWDHKT